jgi:hypothetical protein
MIRKPKRLKPLIALHPDKTTNPCVGGSNPLGRANKNRELANLQPFPSWVGCGWVADGCPGETITGAFFVWPLPNFKGKIWSAAGRAL